MLPLLCAAMLVVCILKLIDGLSLPGLCLVSCQLVLRPPPPPVLLACGMYSWASVCADGLQYAWLQLSLCCLAENVSWFGMLAFGTCCWNFSGY